jgi:hypothetical protein
MQKILPGMSIMKRLGGDEYCKGEKNIGNMHRKSL